MNCAAFNLWIAGTTRRGFSARKSWRLATVLLLVLAAGFSQARTHAQVSREYQIKAVLLFRLAQFAEWPTNRFEAPESPIVIGILGKSPFNGAVAVAVRGETAHNRPIAVRPVQHDDEIRACHILYVSQSEASKVKQITRSLSGRSVLTVSDLEDFATGGGGMVQFLTEKNKVNLRINAETAKAAGIALNSRLLRMAELVKDPAN